ncbi:hypothetical protein PPN31114_00245 [Pandoraea pneumonica]|uniref:HK97 gp10 family phage protein n=1 Tax=Pandoraea pneumonica TaxID=2508299 RepID=A0A5E4RNC0_9BURK|nr:HK97 gp10 family phage protein [Pandoraea pneumonica]VVD63892.1 hypothetical protein PPN31114_00245 [Pandoraea pneumonica]
MAVDWKTSGFSESAAALLKLADDLAESALRSAAVAGGTILRDEAALRAPQGETGNLGRALYLKFIEERSTETSKMYYVSIRGGKKGDGRNDVAFYGPMVEFGHWYVPPKPKGVRWKSHRANSVGKHWVAARPFIRPAWEARKTDAVDAMRNRLKEKLMEIHEARGK